MQSGDHVRDLPLPILMLILDRGCAKTGGEDSRPRLYHEILWLLEIVNRLSGANLFTLAAEDTVIHVPDRNRRDGVGERHANGFTG